MFVISPLFSPLNATYGGLLIGGAATLLLLSSGKIAGWSKMLTEGILKARTASGLSVRWAFLSGALSLATFASYNYPSYFPNLAVNINHPMGFMTVLGAGLLVGYGTSMGNGCTSGHGICGLSRFSVRSAVAVGCFMTSGILTASLLRPMIKIPTTAALSLPYAKEISAGAALVFAAAALYRYGQEKENLLSVGAAYAAGGLFGAGLLLSGMVNWQKTLGFLDLSGTTWDPSLMFVMGGALLVAAPLTSLVILKRSSPLFARKFDLPSSKDITSDLVIGSTIFGIGWGLGGICPGPGFVSLASASSMNVLWIAGMLGGAGLYASTVPTLTSATEHIKQK